MDIEATLTEWEDGCDLVISADAPVDRATVWNYVTDPQQATHWFAPWSRDADILTFDFDGEKLTGEIIGCEDQRFFLLELPFGRVGLSVSDSGGDQHLGTAQGATRVTVTHTFAAYEEAAHAVPEIGPVWDTHVRALLTELGVKNADIDEDSQARKYTNLAVEGM